MIGIVLGTIGEALPPMPIGRSSIVGAERTRVWGPFEALDRETANAVAVGAVQSFGVTRIDDGDRLFGDTAGGGGSSGTSAGVLSLH